MLSWDERRKKEGNQQATAEKRIDSRNVDLEVNAPSNTQLGDINREGDEEPIWMTFERTS